jgi:hypothetical protein
LLAGQFEGDMVFPDGSDPTDPTREVAIFGDRKWLSGVIPYDISAISSKCSKLSLFLYIVVSS